MTIERVPAVLVTCEHDDEQAPCTSLLYCDTGLDDAAVRRAVAERGWSPDPLRCPRHRSDPYPPPPVAAPTAEDPFVCRVCGATSNDPDIRYFLDPDLCHPCSVKSPPG